MLLRLGVVQPREANPDLKADPLGKADLEDFITAVANAV